MNYTLKLAIPLGLGLAAAVVNMMVLQAGTKSVKFIKIKAQYEVAEGDPFTDEALEVLEYPGNEAGSLMESAILWDNRSVLWDRPALRNLSAGDIVLYRDFPLQGDTLQLEKGESSQLVQLGEINIPPAILQINCKLDFLIQFNLDESPVWIGPFRLVSVGDRVANTTDRSGSGGTTNTITVAVRSDLANKTDPTAEEKAQLERQAQLDTFAEKEQQELARLLNVRISPDTQ
ncbi:MAG: hypothetical protein WD851_15180 [Pirellulales bacterium]